MLFKSYDNMMMAVLLDPPQGKLSFSVLSTLSKAIFA